MVVKRVASRDQAIDRSVGFFLGYEKNPSSHMAAGIYLYIESEINDVAVFHDVFFSFESQESKFFGFCGRAAF